MMGAASVKIRMRIDIYISPTSQSAEIFVRDSHRGNTSIQSRIILIWHYDNVEQYHPTRNPDGGLSTQHVNPFMKMKLFGQWNNMDKNIIYNAPKEYFELVMNVANIIKN
uniref:Uncharacterized protein n=1 Tax=Romanomermis culicivorax TaxID=13658 RepID=A0A915KUR0_ROMCU